VWLTLGRNPAHRGAAMTPHSAALVCAAAGRLEGARAAPHVRTGDGAGRRACLVSSAKAGHSSLAITGRYLSKLTSSANPYAEQLEIAFGIA